MGYYTVKTGDSWYKIAGNDYSLVQQLIAGNPGVTNLVPGMRIWKPSAPTNQDTRYGAQGITPTQPPTNVPGNANYTPPTPQPPRPPVTNVPGNANYTPPTPQPPGNTFLATSGYGQSTTPQIGIPPGYTQAEWNNLSPWDKNLALIESGTPIFGGDAAQAWTFAPELGLPPEYDVDTKMATSGYNAYDMFPPHPLDNLDSWDWKKYRSDPVYAEYKLNQVREWENAVYGGMRQNPVQAIKAKYAQDPRWVVENMTEGQRLEAARELKAWEDDYGKYIAEGEGEIYILEEILGFIEPNVGEGDNAGGSRGGSRSSSRGGSRGGGGYPAGYSMRPNNVRRFAGLSTVSWRI